MIKIKTISITILLLSLLANPVFAETYYMDSTAYSSGKITKSGIPVSRGCVAADWGYILKPGDVVYIEGYGYGLVCDTGGKIKGNRIDVFIENDLEANRYGYRKDVKVTKLPQGDLIERLYYEKIKNLIIEGELN